MWRLGLKRPIIWQFAWPRYYLLRKLTPQNWTWLKNRQHVEIDKQRILNRNRHGLEVYDVWW